MGAHFGLTPKKYQSGETDVTGGVSKVGDAMVRTVLYEAANVLLSRTTRFSTLKRWALVLNLKDAAALLDETLQEESQTDEDLTSIADTAVNAEALSSAA